MSWHSTTDKQIRYRLLTLASLFEGEFTVDWLVELSGFKANRILAELQVKVDKKILASSQPGIYFFSNKIIRNQFRENLSADEKAALLSRIADILIHELPEGNDKMIAVSQYLLQIKNDTNHCRILCQAGDAYRHLFLNEQALQCYAKVLQDISVSNEAEADRLFSETAIHYSKISTAQHETTRVLNILEEALTRAKRRDNFPFQALLEMHIAKNEWVRARYDQAIAHFERGWSIATELDDPEFRRSARPFGAFFFYWQGRFRDAVDNYEKSLPDISDYPKRSFPMMGAITVGYCYAQIGQFTQGLGMMDSIRTYCLNKGDQSMASMALANIGETMLTMRRIDEAMQYIQEAIKLSLETQNRWVWISTQVMMAFAHQYNGENEIALSYLKEFLIYSRQVEAIAPHPYILEMCQAMELGRMPRVDGLSMDQEVEHTIQSQNIFLKGLAYRYHAFLLERRNAPVESIIAAYRQSIQWLSISGHTIELARSRIEFARYFISQGEETKAKELTLKAHKILSPINEELIPHDLQGLIPQHHGKTEYMLKKMLELGRQVIRLRSNQELMQHIISITTSVTGAERGAIFLLYDDGPNNKKIGFCASKNLTRDEVDHPDFKASIQLIEETASKGQGVIRSIKMAALPESPLQGVIRSMITVPMILRDQVIGVLYHDNRLLNSVFKEQDIDSLSYFVALATVALDNARAYDEINNLNQKLQEEKIYYEEEHIVYRHYDSIVGNSPAMQKVLQQISHVAETSTTVLITGETGVGKELVARAIHRLSPRTDKPFISVQLSSLAGSLIPSELFGHEKGAFTGATQRRIGRFELADGGTLFMDEIGDIPEEMQIRLLRILQTKQFERVGGTVPLTSDFRLITATNRLLTQEIKAGKFRKDLYYRLNIFPIHVPPLRDRIEDVPLLAQHFLNIHAKKSGKAMDIIPKQEMKKLMQYCWPGNVRELENVIERGVILSTGRQFRIPEFDMPETSDNESETDGTLAAHERQFIVKTLKKTSWKISGQKGAAKLLGVPPSTLSSRMKKLGGCPRIANSPRQT
jgi:transcriptional regulator with GAF, ATPase, and Fis domain